ncbi:hypothetical protein GCM10009863_45250 [Streptomyces axinellae]|uniref:Uncharacterized protein n=1 Tax=Streptomyces axinellae TaxID=552788 RepID=A0ABP6CPU4_9ACTN
MTLSLLKGSVTPLRLITVSDAFSTVVKRREQWGHWRRRLIAAPSSAVRLSTTRLSGCRQKGQCIDSTLPGLSEPSPCMTDSAAQAPSQEPLDAHPSIGQVPPE